MPRRLPTMQATRSTLGAQQAGRQRARGLRPPLGNLAAVLALCLAASAGAQPDPWDDTPGALVRRRLPVAVPPPKPRPPPAPPPGAPPRPAPPPPAAPLCALEVTVEQRATAQALELTVWMRNRSAAPLRFTLASACARPPVQVLGLPSGVDPFGTCNRGPCVQAQPQPVELAPGARQAVASGVVRYAGDSCSAPSAPGPRALGAALTFVGPAPRTCAPAAPPCPKAPPCALGCPAGVGYARDAQGCQRCACAYGLESPSLPPPPPPTRTSPPPLPPLRPPPPPTQPTQPLPPPPPPLRPPAPPPPTPSRPTRPPPPQARCPPPIPCGIGCPGGGGLAKDENGCTQCACDPSGPQVPSELNRR